MKTKRINKESEWQELDPKTVIGANADIVLKNIYELTTKTATQLARELKMDLSLAQKALDYLVKEGRIKRIDKIPYYDEAAYTAVNEERRETHSNGGVNVAARIVWHCLGKHGRLVDKEIGKETGLGQDYTGMAIGWLACEGKLRMFRNTRTEEEAFCLTAAQQKIYNRRKKKK